MPSARSRCRSSDRRRGGPLPGRSGHLLEICRRRINHSGVVIVFEVLSPSSERTDRIVKVREYATVRTIRRYIIVESTFAGITAFERPNADRAWTANTLTGEDVLRLPEVNVEIPASELYEDVEFSGTNNTAGGPPSR